MVESNEDDSDDESSSSEESDSETEEEEEGEEEVQEETLVSRKKGKGKSIQKKEKTKKEGKKKGKDISSSKKVAKRLNFLEEGEEEFPEVSEEFPKAEKNGKKKSGKKGKKDKDLMMEEGNETKDTIEIENDEDMECSQTLDGGPPYTQVTPINPLPVVSTNAPEAAPKLRRSKRTIEKEEKEKNEKNAKVMKSFVDGLPVDVDLSCEDDAMVSKLVKIGNVKLAVGIREGLDNNQKFTFQALTIVRTSKTGKDFEMSFPVSMIPKLIHGLTICRDANPLLNV